MRISAGRTPDRQVALRQVAEEHNVGQVRNPGCQKLGEQKTWDADEV